MRYANAEPTRCYRATPRGFHNVTLVDLTGETGPTVSMEEMSNLRRQWPTSLLTGMTRWQADLETLMREGKSRFRNSQAGSCTYCGRHIIHNMACHVSNYHLDLGQLWRCPVSWCTQWKETPRNYIDHIARNTTWVSQSKLPIWGSGSLRGL